MLRHYPSGTITCGKNMNGQTDVRCRLHLGVYSIKQADYGEHL